MCCGILRAAHLQGTGCVVYTHVKEKRTHVYVAQHLTGLLNVWPRPEEYARAKMEVLSAATLELQSTLEALPLKTGYNVHVESLAIATKTATNIARQVSTFVFQPQPASSTDAVCVPVSCQA